MSRGRRLALAFLISAAFCARGAEPADAATLFDPALRFRVLRTDHFRIYFHQREDRLAARLATIAEDTWLALERPFAARPPRLTHVVLADQTDLPNGYATPIPYDTIVIFPAAPPGSEFATNDWLRLVFTHEFTHIVHLDRSEGWARIARSIFGRTPLAFPNLFLPTWQVEGLATYEESAITGEGRLHAGDFRAVVGEAARRRQLEPIDRVSGGLTDWPAGLGPYAYGMGFHQYLAGRFGPGSLAALADATARRAPYMSSPVFRRLFGQSLGELWQAYERSLAAPADPGPSDEGVTRLTDHGFLSAGPRFDPASGGIVYTKRTPDAFPSLDRIDLSGANLGRLATRYFGSTTAVGASALYFDQLEFRRNVALEGDLYEWSRGNGQVRALTKGARLRDPDLSPDGATLAAVQERTTGRDLVLVHPGDATVITLASGADTYYDAPRWSPDGRRIAVARQRLGYDPDIVVVDAGTGTLRVAAAAAGARIVMPAWRPDGLAIVAAVAPGDRVFNLVEFSLADPSEARQLTHTTGGATWPDVSSDGRLLIFSGYTTAGYDIFSMPYPADAAAVRVGDAEPPAAAVAAGNRELPAASSYSPFATLRPTTWSPVVEWDGDQLRAGAFADGRDVLGYHAWAASATWLAASPSGAPTPPSASPDWFASYAYDRWRPTLFASASVETLFFAGPATSRGTPSAATRRQRQVTGGVLVPFIRARQSHAALASVVRSVDDYTSADGAFARDRTAVRGAWRTTTARTYGYSVSPEDGIALGATAELVRRALGSSGDAATVTGDFRAYVPGARTHHVVAARLAAGVSSGDPTVGRTFVLGGAAPDASVIDFGGGAFSLMRGFGANRFAGSRVALLNADYRWPIARPQRGAGTWPLFLHTVHAAVFVDAGHAWTRAFEARAIKTSIGGELSANIVAGFHFPFTAAAGAAWGRDGSGTSAGGLAVYARVGRAF